MKKLLPFASSALRRLLHLLRPGKRAREFRNL